MSIMLVEHKIAILIVIIHYTLIQDVASIETDTLTLFTSKNDLTNKLHETFVVTLNTLQVF